MDGVGGGEYEEKKDSDGFVIEFDRRVATVQVAARHNAAFHISEQNFMVKDYFHPLYLCIFVYLYLCIFVSLYLCIFGIFIYLHLHQNLE